MFNDVYNDLLSEIYSMPVIDTHEHLMSEESRLASVPDLFSTFMLHYASCDLISAGMKIDDMNFLKSNSGDLDRKWQLFAPFWEKSKNTAYCKALVYAIKDIYGFDDIDEATYRNIDAAIKASNIKGLYQRILKDMCHIEVSILDSNPDCDKHFFISTFNIGDYVRFSSKDHIVNLEKLHNVSINNLNDYIDLMRKLVTSCLHEKTIVCMKSALAYQRVIRYDRVDYSTADRIFTQMLASGNFVGWYSHSPADFPTKQLEDYIMHSFVQIAGELDIPIQIHTGLQEGNGNLISNSNPVLLTNLFLEYPKTRFDIFHASYPYAGELCALAKNFSNVYVDLCWAHIISREYTVAIIEELIETVPANKVFGFGGDFIFVEGTYGHLKMARENIARALANKIIKGYLNREEALVIAKRLLYDNAKEFFKL